MTDIPADEPAPIQPRLPENRGGGLAALLRSPGV